MPIKKEITRKSLINQACIITVYYPDTKKFENDLKTRRRGNKYVYVL